MSTLQDVPRSALLERLERLDGELNGRDVQCELCVAGGAVVSLVFSSRPRTRNIRALFQPQSRLREAAEAVASAMGLESRWLSDTVRRLLGPQEGGIDSFLELPDLRVYHAPPAYLLAMRCAALGLGDSSVVEDIRYLLRYLDLTSRDEALQSIHGYFGAHQLPGGLSATLDALSNPAPA